MSNWVVALIGIILVGIAFFFFMGSSNWFYGVIIGAIGFFLLMVAFERSRILFNRWLNRE